MGATRRYGWYLAALQFFFALTWTVYVVYLPKLADAALLYLAASRAKRWLMR